MCGIEGDGADAAAGDGGADGGAVPHAGQGEVVDVLGAAQDFGGAFFANGGGADDRGRLDIEVLHKNRRECQVWLVPVSISLPKRGTPPGGYPM